MLPEAKWFYREQGKYRIIQRCEEEGSEEGSKFKKNPPKEFKAMKEGDKGCPGQ